MLSGFALGPSWARATGATPKPSPAGEGERPPRRDAPRDDDGRRDKRHQDSERTGRLPQRGHGGRRDERPPGPPRREEAPPADGVRVTLTPDKQAVHLIGREIHQVARVYPLFDVARILLAERGRCRAVFEAPEPRTPLWLGKLDESLFLTRDEAVNHLWQSALKETFIEEQTVETDPPSGNFQIVAKCGLTGLWLGPPNYHAYQSSLRRIHRECFPHMSFADYSARVRTERGEDAVNAWLATMTRKTRWRIKGDGDDAWTDDSADARRALASRCLDQAFEETRRAEVLASIAPQNLSSALMTSLKMAGNHARNHPALLIPAICKALEAEHLPVFKRQGKLFTGPARPHPLPPGQALAERPSIMVSWIRANPPAKLEGLWQAVLPEGGTAPPAEFAADLFWLLHQGHILLFTDDTLVVQEVREHAPTPQDGGSATGKKKKRKNKNPAADAPATAPQDTDTTPSGPVDSPAEDDSVSDNHTGAPPEATDSTMLDVPAEIPGNPEPGVDESSPL